MLSNLMTELQASTSSRRHIALIGFMGCGKTTTGRLLAKRHRLKFIDLDEVIVEQSGQSIIDIFNAGGESVFRSCERAALRSVLASTTPAVIATGGGTFADPTMRTWIQNAAHSVYLQAEPNALIKRLDQSGQKEKRPLLGGPNPAGTIRFLLNERTPLYRK
ncbi:MAG TPA: shikimate kinase, partial [Flavobacteriales bacterium]|nr:shikimate kinase [Flavobacteriales bacterium]